MLKKDLRKLSEGTSDAAYVVNSEGVVVAWNKAAETLFGVSAKKAKNQKKTRKKRTALVICHNGKQFWTTQVEFWQWVRDSVVVKMQDQPLTGVFRREGEELKILRNHSTHGFTYRYRADQNIVQPPPRKKREELRLLVIRLSFINAICPAIERRVGHQLLG